MWRPRRGLSVCRAPRGPLRPRPPGRRPGRLSRAQVERAHRHIEEHFSTASYAHRIHEIQAEIAASVPSRPAAQARADAHGGWVSIATRRPADGERRRTGWRHGIRAERRGRDAALATLRALADTLPDGMPLTPDLAGAAWQAGVTDVAQQVGGEVVRFTAG